MLQASPTRDHGRKSASLSKPVRRASVIWDKPISPRQSPTMQREANRDSVTGLKEAVVEGNTEKARAVLQQHPEVAKDAIGILYLAVKCAQQNQIEMMALLLAAGAGRGWQDDDGQTALHCAVAANNLEAVNVLVEKTPCLELTIEDHYEMTPFHLACEEGDPSVVKALLPPLQRLGLSDPRVVRRLRSGSALFLAQRHGHHAVVELLTSETIPSECVGAESATSYTRNIVRMPRVASVGNVTWG